MAAAVVAASAAATVLLSAIEAVTADKSLLLPLLLIGPGAAAAPLAAVPLLELQQAEFSGDDGATWSRVALPDTWAQRGVDVGSAGRYRIAFELPAQPDEPVALLLTRLSTHHRVH